MADAAPLRPPEGLRFCRAALRRAAAATSSTARHARRCVVFDFDNTMVDKRPTTLAAAKQSAEPKLARLRLPQVGWDGRTTATAAGLSPVKAKAFHRAWNAFFWDPENFVVHDRAIKKTVRLAQAAKAAGCEVFYLTGRYDSLKRATVKQLKKHGLPDADGRHVICKPEGAPTEAFKIDRMRRLQRRREVLFFVSDAHSDIAALQGATRAPCVLVDFPVKPPGPLPAIRPDTPVIRVR